MARKAPWKLLAVVAVGASVWTASRWLPLGDWLATVPETAQAWGPLGLVVFAILYAAATILALPVSALTLGAGLAWGPLVGFVAVWPGAVLGATVAFVLGRTVLRGSVEDRLADHPRFAAIDAAVADDALVLVTLLRLTPLVPFSALNYGLGLTGVSARSYAIATAVGIVPGTFLYAYLGSLGRLADGEAGPARWLVAGLGLAATLGVTVWITRTARTALDARLDTPSPEEAS